MKRKILAILIIALGLLIFSGVYVLNTNAQETENYPSIVQKIANKFNLNTNEVQKVFDEDRKEKEIEHQARFEERLTKAVEEDKITNEQKEAILKKETEIRQKRKELSELSPEKRREAMQQLRDEMEKWLKENGINLGKLGLGPKGPRKSCPGLD